MWSIALAATAGSYPQARELRCTYLTLESKVESFEQEPLVQLCVVGWTGNWQGVNGGGHQFLPDTILFRNLAGATVTEVAISWDLGPLRSYTTTEPTEASRTEQELTLAAVCETRTCRPALHDQGQIQIFAIEEHHRQSLSLRFWIQSIHSRVGGMFPREFV